MRKLALLTTFAALIFTTGTASAQNDFEALLSEIDFGGGLSPNTAARAQGDTLTMDNIPVDKLAPAPTPEPVQAPVADPVASPAPDATTQTLSEPVVADPQTYQPIADCGQGAACDGGCASGSCRNGSCRSGRGGLRGLCRSNKEEYCNTCVPHSPPNLPTSSFREYFKSDACNARVWDGWQNRCHGSSKHSRGECDCFDPKEKRSCLSGFRLGGNRCQTGACNPRVCPASNCNTSSGAGCLQLPSAWRVKGDCDGQIGCAAAPACDSPGCDG